MRRATWWVLAVLPLLAGVVLDVGARAGWFADRRLRIEVSALRGDWLLAAGIAVTGLLVLLLAVRTRADVLGRRRLGAERAAAARDRQLLMSRLDHELKNPLTAMRAAVANVTAAGPGPEQEAGLRSIEEQVLRLSRLTADLRKIADVEGNRVDRRPVDVTELVEEAVEVLREQPGAAARRISADLPRAPWPLPAVLGDGDLLLLAVGNLLDNALKYTPPGGRVEVRARESAGDVVVEVADTGAGIAADDLPHVWDTLYRGQRTRAVPGSGLGLPLVRAVAERHGGSVTVESREGSGTVVRLTLPGDGPARTAQPAT
ncbi:HAMP domain-containing sensor histidine kinase [Modestobacter sp. NPDC049651]|uniref:sensor histidine kinase n=1 Tax=unclassified Modestobacter TaxID=2643866 RepID=UPI0033C203F6